MTVKPEIKYRPKDEGILPYYKTGRSFGQNVVLFLAAIMAFFFGYYFLIIINWI